MQVCRWLAAGLLAACLTSSAQADGPRATYIVDGSAILIFHDGKVSRIEGRRTGLGSAVSIARQTLGDLVVSNRGSHDGAPGSIVTLPPRKGNAQARFVISCEAMSPWGIALDADSNIWMTDYDTDEVRAYPANADGCPAPLATIKGAHTLLDKPQVVAIDGKGRIVVVNYLSGVLVFAPGADGDVAPIAQIPLGSAHVEGIALDAGDHIWVSEYANQKIVEFAAGAKKTAPLRTIEGAATGLVAPVGLAIERTTGKVYVADYGARRVAVYAAGAQGNAAPIAVFDRGGFPFAIAFK